MPIRSFVSFNLIDGIKRSCGNTFYVSNAAAQAYVAAADDTARGLTLIGILQAKYLGLTEAQRVDTTVSYENYVNAPANVDDDVLRGNKLHFDVVGGGVNRDFAIPARQATAFEQQSESLDVSITSPTAMAEFVDAYNDVVLDAFGNARVITDARVVD